MSHGRRHRILQNPGLKVRKRIDNQLARPVPVVDGAIRVLLEVIVPNARLPRHEAQSEHEEFVRVVAEIITRRAPSLYPAAGKLDLAAPGVHSARGCADHSTEHALFPRNLHGEQDDTDRSGCQVELRLNAEWTSMLFHGRLPPNERRSSYGADWAVPPILLCRAVALVAVIPKADTH